MVSMMQMEKARKLADQGMIDVGTPRTESTPIPGLLLMMDEQHSKLMLVLGDGTAVDLLKVYRLAENCIRNWQKGSTMPGFVGDFKRLVPLTKALNGDR